MERKQRTYQIVCVIAGFFLYGVAALTGQSEDIVSNGYLELGDYGEDPRIYDLLVEGILEEPIDYQAQVRPIQYKKEKADQVFDKVAEELEDQMRGKNPSLSEIRFDLELPDKVSQYGVSILWESENPDILDSFGRIQIEDCPEKGVETAINAVLTTGNYKRNVVFPLRIYPRSFTPEEKLTAFLQKQIELEDSQNPTEKKVALPTEYKGKILHYKEKKDKDYRLFPVFGCLAAFLLYAREKKREEDVKKERKQKLLLDYADVVYQLMVFTRAGLTVGRAWERIVLNYETRRKSKRYESRPVYEEMVKTFQEMQCGQPEGKAIMEFGKRCQLQSYLKLTTLLEQNRRTGAKNLQQVLEQEMISAWEQQKNVARRMGEEAGTKLLLPLFLMLFVVMVLVMTPAMMAMA